MLRSRTVVGMVALVAVLSLSGCGSDDAAPEDATEEPAVSGGPPGGFDASQLEEIRECLEAAGLEDKMPEMPTDIPTDMPTDMPTGFPGGGMSGLQDDPEVQEALDACGVELPQPPESESSP